MNKQKKRLMIAQDVIDALDMGIFLAKEHNGYIEFETGEEVSTVEDLLPMLRPDKPCTVCAIGSAALSLARINDSDIKATPMEPRHFGDGGTEYYADFYEFYSTLLEYFTEEEIAAMEIAFEGESISSMGAGQLFQDGDYDALTHETLSLFDSAKRFYSNRKRLGREKSSMEILKEIWTRFLENDGEFDFVDR